MTIRLHRGDLPDLARYRGGAVAIDTETMGLDPHRDRLCVVQLSPGDGSADVVQIPPGAANAPNLVKLLADPAVLNAAIWYSVRGSDPMPPAGRLAAVDAIQTGLDAEGEEAARQPLVMARLALRKQLHVR